MPTATRLPTNGGTNSGLSAATSERAGWPSTGPGLVGGLRRSAGAQVALGDLAPEAGSSSPVSLELDQAVHGAQALEGVAAVEEAPVVDLAQVALDVGAGQRGTAEQHRDVGQAALVHLVQVLAHDQRRLHQQAAHADGVGLVLLGRPPPSR